MHYLTQRPERAERSREERKTLAHARNPAGKGERPIYHWKDALQEVNTFPRRKRWNELKR